MNVLLLINHQTASKFYCEVLKANGHNVYVPLISEKYALECDAVKKYRSINDNDLANELDNFLFYQNHTFDELNKIIDIINRNFTVVIALYTVNNELLKLFSLSSKLRVYFMLWGDVHFHYSNVHNNILNTNNKYYLIAHDYLLQKYETKYNIPKNKIKYYELGLYFENKNVIDSYTHNQENNILIIMSRIHIINTRNLITTIAQLNKNITFHIYGICNNVTFNDVSNVILHNALDNVEDLYKEIKNYKFAINFNIFEDVLQYSPVEFAAIGIPFLYPSYGALFKIIGHSDIFTYNDINDMCGKINYIIRDDNLDKHKEEYKKINATLYNKYKFENLVDSYKNI